MKLHHRLARTLRGWADRLDPPAINPARSLVAVAGVGPEMAKANRMILAMHLRRALRRYSPEEQPAQA